MPRFTAVAMRQVSADGAAAALRNGSTPTLNTGGRCPWRRTGDATQCPRTRGTPCRPLANASRGRLRLARRAGAQAQWAAHDGTSLRPVSRSRPTEELLLDLYASRADELARVPWTAEQKHAFLAQQFQAQQQAYRAYEGATFEVIDQDGERSAASTWLAGPPRSASWTSPCSAHHNRGIGRGSSVTSQEEAAASGRPDDPRGTLQPGAEAVRAAGLPGRGGTR